MAAAYSPGASLACHFIGRKKQSCPTTCHRAAARDRRPKSEWHSCKLTQRTPAFQLEKSQSTRAEHVNQAGFLMPSQFPEETVAASFLDG